MSGNRLDTAAHVILFAKRRQEGEEHILVAKLVG